MGEINYKRDMDGGATQLNDVVSELDRWYVYVLDKTGDREKLFIDLNSISFISYKEPEGDKLFNFETEDGAIHETTKYLEGYKVKTETQTFGNLVSGSSATNEDRFEVLSNQFYSNPDGKYHIMTKGEPFDPVKYKNNEQKVFLVAEVVYVNDEFDKETLQDVGLIDDSAIVSFSLMNIKLITDSYIGSKLEFVRGYSLTKDNIGIDIDGVSKLGFELEVDNTSLIDSVIVVGKDSDSGNRKQFDVTTNRKMIPIKATPFDSFDNQIKLTFPWFDYDYQPPYAIIEKFLEATSIIDFFKDILETSNEDDYNEEVNLINDLLSYGESYKTNFSQYKRLDSGGDAGKLDPLQFVGSRDDETAQYISALEGRSPLESCDGLIKEWETRFPDRVNSLAYTYAKLLINMLSLYIVSSKSTAGGLNEFVRFNSNWSLKTNSGIRLESQDYTIPDGGGSGGGSGDRFSVNMADTTFEFDSSFFELDVQNKKVILKETDITRNKTIQADTRMILEGVPDYIQPMSVAAQPLDFNAESLKYLLFVPNDNDDVIKSLYLDTLEQVAFEPVPLDSRPYIEPDVDNLFEFLKNDVVDQLGFDPDDVEITFEGTRRDASTFALRIDVDDDLIDKHNQWIPNTPTSPPQWRDITEAIAKEIFDRDYPQYVNEFVSLATFDAEYQRYVSDRGRLFTLGRGYFLVNIRRYYRENYTYLYSGVPISNNLEQQKNIFSLDGWKNIIQTRVNTIDSGNTEFRIPIYSLYDNIGEIERIIISGIWLKKFNLLFDTEVFNVETPFQDNELISSYKIIFT